MALTFPVPRQRQRLDGVGDSLRGRRDVIARAAERAVRAASHSDLPKLAAVAALGFAAGLATLAGRKLVSRAMAAWAARDHRGAAEMRPAPAWAIVWSRRRTAA